MLTPENKLVDIDDLNKFRIGDSVVADESADHDRFEGTVIGIEFQRIHGRIQQPSITLLHDGDQITDGFKPGDLRQTNKPSPGNRAITGETVRGEGLHLSPPDITLWKPEPDILIHQALGKSGEEASELAKILFRCSIQGLNASEPVTGKPNRKALFEEIADVLAATQWLRDLIGDEFDQARFERKLAGFRHWQAMLEEDAGHGHCDICAKPILADDICATDIELGICHAACLEGSPTVDLETGDPVDGKIETYRYGDLASPAGWTEGASHV